MFIRSLFLGFSVSWRSFWLRASGQGWRGKRIKWMLLCESSQVQGTTPAPDDHHRPHYWLDKESAFICSGLERHFSSMYSSNIPHMQKANSPHRSPREGPVTGRAAQPPPPPSLQPSTGCSSHFHTTFACLALRALPVSLAIPAGGSLSGQMGHWEAEETS